MVHSDVLNDKQNDKYVAGCGHDDSVHAVDYYMISSMPDVIITVFDWNLSVDCIVN